MTSIFGYIALVIVPIIMYFLYKYSYLKNYDNLTVKKQEDLAKKLKNLEDISNSTTSIEKEKIHENEKVINDIKKEIKKLENNESIITHEDESLDTSIESFLEDVGITLEK